MTPEQLRECPIDQCAENTDREIYRGPDDGCGDFYSDSLHITQEGALGIDCGGYVIVRPIRAWHGIAKAHADALEELARVKAELLGVKEYRERNPLGGPAKVFDAMADQIRSGDDFNRVIADYGWCPVDRAERAEAALAESERKCERGCFCLMEMMQAYERRVRSLCAPEEIEKRPWESAEYNKAAEYLRAVWKPDAYRAEFKGE